MKATAIYALTPQGAELGRHLSARLHGDLFLSRDIASRRGEITFDSIMEMVRAVFHGYRNHIFITAAGIAVRAIAPCIKSKDQDPAVVVLDQRGRYCVSLLSGHLGGANALARRVASLTGGREVITTATDTEGLPSIDLLALEKGLAIANLPVLKWVNAALLKGTPIQIFDPQDRLGLRSHSPKGVALEYCESKTAWTRGTPGIWVDWRTTPPPEDALLLHPRCVVAGIGCNRGTCADEIVTLIRETLDRKGISLKSLGTLATIDQKRDETGLLEATAHLGLPLRFFSRQEISGVSVPNPSAKVKQHMGVESVCEATALLGAGKGRLVVPKIKSGNVTIALALKR